MPATFRLVVTTQYQENYGAHDWDGKGECPQYWKSKGGNEHILVPGLTLQEVQELGSAGLQAIVSHYRPIIENRSHYSEEYIIDWSLYSTDEETPDERFEREYAQLYATPRMIEMQAAYS